MTVVGTILTAAFTCCAYHIVEGIIKEISYKIETRKKTKKEGK